VPEISELQKLHETQTQTNSPRDVLAKMRIMFHFSTPGGSPLVYNEMTNEKEHPMS